MNNFVILIIMSEIKTIQKFYFTQTQIQLVENTIPALNAVYHDYLKLCKSNRNFYVKELAFIIMDLKSFYADVVVKRKSYDPKFILSLTRSVGQLNKKFKSLDYSEFGVLMSQVSDFHINLLRWKRDIINLLEASLD